MESLQSIAKQHTTVTRKPNTIGYHKILEWYLSGEPRPVAEMWSYGDFAEWRPGPGMKRSLWPDHHDYVALAKKLTDETRSAWVRDVIFANREGTAVAFHHAMSKLSPIDEYVRRAIEHEKEVARDELYHGPKLIRSLARIVPSEVESEEAVRKITELRVQKLRQRNEQFRHPLCKGGDGTTRAPFARTVPLFSAMEATQHWCRIIFHPTRAAAPRLRGTVTRKPHDKRR
jgi:hypothetical protein